MSHETSVIDTEDDWCEIVPAVKLCASHQTVNVPALQCLLQTRLFFNKMINATRRPLLSTVRFNEMFDYYLTDIGEKGWDESMAFLLPRRLVDDANEWYGGAREPDGGYDEVVVTSSLEEQLI